MRSLSVQVEQQHTALTIRSGIAASEKPLLQWGPEATEASAVVLVKVEGVESAAEACLEVTQ